MKVEDSLYFDFKKLLFAAKEMLLDKNGAPLRKKDVSNEDLNELESKIILIRAKLREFMI